MLFEQWIEKRSERLKKPSKVTRGKSNLSSWKVPKILAIIKLLRKRSCPTLLTISSQVFIRPGQARSVGGDEKPSWRLLHKGDRQRPGGLRTTLGAKVIKNQVMYELTTCIAAAIDADVCNLYLVEEEGQLSVFPRGSGSG